MSALGLALSLLIGAFLGFFGGGGSILTVPLLVYVFELPPKEAIASSLLIVAGASVLGAVQHWRNGNLDTRTGLLFGASGMLGAFAGGRAAVFFDGALLMLLFAAMMVLTALAMWRGRRTPKASSTPTHPEARLLAQGLGVGVFTGLVGAGGGFLIVPTLVLWGGLPMTTAVGTSLLIIVMKSLAGFWGYLSHVAVDYGIVVAVSAVAIVGSFLGAGLAHRVDPATLRRTFASFVMVMAVFILGRETEVWMTTARAALPSSAPEILFALLILVIGIAAGRASQRAGASLSEGAFEEGAGI